MFIELHILQNFAPSNLNRDDTNAPKDCEFGGYRRARISSQCLKRAMRTAFREDDLLPRDDMAVRTKRLAEALTRRMQERAGKSADEAEQVAEAAIHGLGLEFDKKNPENTQYLLFLGEREIEGLAAACLENWDVLCAVPPGDTEGRTARQVKRGGKDALTADVAKALSAVLDGGRAADLALFGRMLADLPGKNVDAACQVAHAISTNQVSQEFDFYTAIDDLKREEVDEDAGAGMMGTIEFNSACFYRYANLDVDQLLANLGGDADLARRTTEAFLLASVRAIPTGKQNSMAAHNPPSLVLAVVRGRGLQNLANAFVSPVTPRGGGLIANSVRQLNDYYGRVQRMHGSSGAAVTWLATTEEGTESLAKEAVSVDVLVDGVVDAAGLNGRAA